jgi:hypothetical protein
MDKPSYVVLEHIFQVSASQLRSCSFHRSSRPYDSRLCKESYTLLVARFGLEAESWVPTIVLESVLASSREPLRRQYKEQSRSPRQAAPANRVFSSPYHYTEVSPLLHNNNLSRMSEVWHSQPVSRNSSYNPYDGCQTRHEQQLDRDSHIYPYGRFRRNEQSGHAPGPKNSCKVTGLCLGLLFSLLVFGVFLWRHF